MKRMSSIKLNQHMCSELLRFLDREDSFLTRVQQCVARISKQPVGRSFPRQLIEELADIQHEAGLQNIDRATLKSVLSAQLLKSPAALRVSKIDAGPELTQQLQSRRKQVFEKAMSVNSSLQILFGQLRESNLITMSVLESVLGVPIDQSRYGSDGKAIQSLGHLEVHGAAWCGVRDDFLGFKL